MEKEENTFSFETIRILMESYHLSFWADVVSILSVLIGIATLVLIYFTKNSIKKTLVSKNVIVDATNAISKMKSIIDKQRTGDWEDALGFYGEVAITLGAIKSSGIKFNKNQLGKLQAAITNTRANEKIIEKKIVKGEQPDRVALNSNMGDQIDDLQEILLSIKTEL